MRTGSPPSLKKMHHRHGPRTVLWKTASSKKRKVEEQQVEEQQEGGWMDMLGLSSSEHEPESRPASTLSSLVPEAKLEEESASTKAGKKGHTRASAKKDSAAKKEQAHAKKRQHRG